MPSVSHNLHSTRELILTTNISQEPYAPVTCLKPQENPNANLHKFLYVTFNIQMLHICK
jgi:hypothetical protein